MSGFVRKVTTCAVALSLVAVPTATVASTPVLSAAAAAPTAAAPSAANPWLALSAMTTSSSATSSAALRHEEGHAGFPPIPVLLVILATIGVAIYIATSDDDGEIDGLDISPR